ncbi:MAG: hypothetical protein JXQ75_11975 [Phycisphaerae bacterium]|nr:hypothetical protein [Phycisphaerae bacterium]
MNWLMDNPVQHSCVPAVSAAAPSPCDAAGPAVASRVGSSCCHLDAVFHTTARSRLAPGATEFARGGHPGVRDSWGGCHWQLACQCVCPRAHQRDRTGGQAARGTRNRMPPEVSRARHSVEVFGYRPTKVGASWAHLSRALRSFARWAPLKWVLAVLLLLCAACQSGFTIKVEKLEGVSGRWDGDWDTVLSSVRDVLLDLDQLCVECEVTYGDVAVRQVQCPLPSTQAAIRSLLPLVEDLMARRARGEVGGRVLAAQADALRRRAVELTQKVAVRSLDHVIATEPDNDRRYAMTVLAERLPAEVQDYTMKLRSLPAGSAGFGGFRQAGVYSINPGDPMYDAVLKAPAANSPLTSVSTRATGDAGTMIVQESPGQMRLYQISNDPISVMRNATLILDKVLQAAVKFDSAGGS